jgi:hypothetical protein
MIILIFEYMHNYTTDEKIVKRTLIQAFPQS